jgi:carboxypeptidase Taq
MQKAIARLRGINKEYRLLANVNALLDWDQEVYMPSGGIEGRSEECALIQGLAHERLVSAEVPSLLRELGVSDAQPSGDPGIPPEDRAFLRCFYRTWLQASRLPAEFVTEMAKLTSLSQACWAESRARDDFPAFLPYLSKMVEMKRQETEYLGFSAKPYDGLLDMYEPASTEASLETVFGELERGLETLLSKIRAAEVVDDTMLRRHCPPEAQERFSRRVMALLGFSQERGRLDVSAHPFTTTIGANDVRITTRYLPSNLGSSISSTIHETGHALYELGLPEKWRYSELGEAASMAVHESQSRFWENIVGRSLAFWEGQFEQLRTEVSPVLDDVTLGAFYRGFNKVEPSLIRVDADEVTYSLHVILRFRLESALFSGALAAADIPSAWNELSRKSLGVEVPRDSLGCLQDIHWSMGSFGYFPSYALGNLYAAQFSAAMERELGPIAPFLSRAEYGPILEWLRRNVHSQASFRYPADLVLSVTGKPLGTEDFLRYLNDKYSGIYRF